MTKLSETIATLRAIADLPAAEARALPGRFYTDPDFFRFEMEEILAHEWHCLGRADEIPAAGDFFTTRLLDEPVMVVRDEAGEVRVLSNVCRHRGMPIAEGRGSRKRFACAYHAWTYATDGRLVAAPRMSPARVGTGCDLPAFRSETWNGFVYATLDEQAPPLTPRLGDLDRLLANYRTEEMRFVTSGEETWETNWKCLVENFMEAYHLSVVHPKTLHPYTPTALSRKSTASDAFTAYEANYPAHAETRGAGAPGLSNDERRCSTLFALFPLQVVSQAATLLVSFSIRPLAVDRIAVRWTMSTWGDELGEKTLEERVALWLEVNREDREKLEKMQKVLASRHAVGGPLAPDDFEGTIRDFVRWLGGRIGADERTLAATP